MQPALTKIENNIGPIFEDDDRERPTAGCQTPYVAAMTFKTLIFQETLHVCISRGKNNIERLPE